VRVRVRPRGFRVKALAVVTTIREPAAASRAELAALSRARWPAERKLRSLKETLPMDSVRGQSPERVRKELGGPRLVSNRVRGRLAQAARTAGLLPREGSFKGALPTCNAFGPLLKGARSAAAALRLWRVMLWARGHHAVGDRPDRDEARKVKRRPQHHELLNEPRSKARKRLATRT
jgi:hypothetical protein